MCGNLFLVGWEERIGHKYCGRKILMQSIKKRKKKKNQNIDVFQPPSKEIASKLGEIGTVDKQSVIIRGK